ncbi:MAG: hypothetical protein GX838_07060 [Clostridiaceae bacterium]|nr:hypothetical protein [Clostridiaceae bacterium]
MTEKKITQERLANGIGISENSLARKINGHRDFWYWEVVIITRLLGYHNIIEVFPELYKQAISQVPQVPQVTAGRAG